MLILGLLCAIPALIFTFRWFKHHKFEYLDGVPVSQQLDKDFWICLPLLVLSCALTIAGLLV